MSNDLNTIVNKLSELTILEAAELTKLLEEKWGVSASIPIQIAPSSSTSQAVEEKTEFDVILTNVGNKKLDVIKELRIITGLPLPEAKGLSEGLPKTIKQGVNKSDAESIKSKLESIGAKVDLK